MSVFLEPEYVYLRIYIQLGTYAHLGIGIYIQVAQPLRLPGCISVQVLCGYYYGFRFNPSAN